MAVELFRSRKQELPALEELATVASECGPASGGLSGCLKACWRYQVLSYEAPWGVGYLVATRQVEAGPGKPYLRPS